MSKGQSVRLRPIPIWLTSEVHAMRPIRTLIAAAVIFCPLAGAAMAVDTVGADAFLPVKQAAPDPEGASSICRGYDWACVSGGLSPAEADVLKVAAQVNRAANPQSARSATNARLSWRNAGPSQRHAAVIVKMMRFARNSS
jgi:hypothetical protein